LTTFRTDLTDVALVFVATNERQVVLQALESLEYFRPQRRLEVVVVDNASTDMTEESIRSAFPSVRVLPRESRAGLAANLNFGIDETTAPYVMLCNSDIAFRDGSIDELAAFLDDTPRAGMAAPILLSAEGSVRPSARRWYTWGALASLKGPWRGLLSRFEVVRRSVYADWDMRDARRVDWVPCPATMVRRAALEETGLLDEKFPLYFNDVDICMRMHLAGWEIWCVPEAEVVHLEQRASLSPFTSAWWSHLGSLSAFWLKHRGLRPRPRPLQDRSP
jgi:N-acetylglucosaminyl-diphospho-decaprenol L-rhamnosyltransferase